MKFEMVKDLDDEKFRRLTGVKRTTFSKMTLILEQSSNGKVDVHLPPSARGKKKLYLMIEIFNMLRHETDLRRTRDKSPATRRAFETGS